MLDDTTSSSSWEIVQNAMSPLPPASGEEQQPRRGCCHRFWFGFCDCLLDLLKCLICYDMIAVEI